jgi:hypothetical protein
MLGVEMTGGQKLSHFAEGFQEGDPVSFLRAAPSRKLTGV